MWPKLLNIIHQFWQIPTRRIATIGQALASQFALPFTRILLSLMVVRWYSEAFWGTYVQYLIIVQLCGALINLGSRDMLLRAFSQSPDQIKPTLAISIASRILVALPLILLLYFLPFGKLDPDLLLVWILVQLSWQFFEALNVYRRLFWQTALIELGIILALIGVFLIWSLPLMTFLWLMVVAELFKALIYWTLNRSFISFNTLNWPQLNTFFKTTFPFLILVLTGALASRGELYLLAIKMDAVALGKYQVLSNFVQSSHLLATAILLPFIKNVYRLKTSVLLDMERHFLAFGLLLTPVLSTLIFGLLRYAYGFHFSYQVYLLLGALIFLYFFQVIRIQILFRQNQVYHVSLLLLLMGVVKVLAGAYLIPRMGIEGALLAAVLAYIAGNVGFWQVRIKSLAS